MPVRIRWAVAGLVVLVLLAAVGWYVLGPSTAATAGHTLGRAGGTIADPHHGVAVEVAPGGVTPGTSIAFRDPGRSLPESPLAALFDVLVQPVDIVPVGGTITNASVVFTIDPAAIPAGRTIQNAGVEVFNNDMDTWVPIPTQVRGKDQLVARAPHFSIFRTVINKIGNVVIDAGRAVTVVLTAAMKPVDILWSVGLGLFKTFFEDITGRFEASKYTCDPRNQGYQVTVVDDTRQGELAACVVKRSDGTSELHIKDGLAIPMKFSAAGTTGLSPSFNGVDELPTMVRGFADMLLGSAAVSGLDVTALHMATGTPKKFTVNGTLSWVAAGVDILVGLLTVLLPETKSVTVTYRSVLVEVEERLAVSAGKDMTAVSFTSVTSVLESVVRTQKVSPTVYGQASMVLAAINCAVAPLEGVKIRHWSEVVPTIVDVIHTCLDTAVKLAKVSEWEDALKLLANIVSQAKTIPEIGQLAAIGILDLFTGSNVAKVAFTVTNFDAHQAFAGYVGTWAQHGYELTIRSDMTGDLVGINSAGTDGTPGPPDYRERASFTFSVSPGGITARVTSAANPNGDRNSVWYSPWYKRGQVVTLRMDAQPGVIDLDTAKYCDETAYQTGVCGA